MIPEKSARSGSRASGIPRARSASASDAFVSMPNRGSDRLDLPIRERRAIDVEAVGVEIRLEGRQVVGDDDGHRQLAAEVRELDRPPAVPAA